MFILNFTFILYSLLFITLFSFLGFGLTVLFCPGQLLKYTAFFSPLIGYCFLTLAGWLFYNLNFKGTDDYYYWILLLSLLFLIAAVVKIWRQRILTKLFSRELIIPTLIAIVVFLAIAIPSLYQKQMTSLSLANADIAYYAHVSKILKELPKNDIPIIIDYLVFPVRLLGTVINTAFFSSVAKLDPYQVQMISIYIFFIISLFLTYILAREVFGYTSFAADITVLLFGLNSLIYYLIYQGFEAQMIAMSLMLMILLVNVVVIRTTKFWEAVRYAPFLFLSLWGLSLTYSYMLAIIYGLVISYVLLSYWKSRKAAQLVNWTSINCIALLAIVCLAPQRLQMIIYNTISANSNTGGWFVPWITPQKLYGVTPLLNYDPLVPNPDSLLLSPDPLVITIIVSIVVVAMIVSGFIKLHRSDRENFLLSLSTFLLIFTGALILSVKYFVTGGLGFGGYHQFKVISFFFPLLLISSLVIFRDTTFYIRNISQPYIKSGHPDLRLKENTLHLLIIGGLVIANSISAGEMIYYATRNAMTIAPDIIELQTIGKNPDIESINIPAGDPDNQNRSFWNTRWEVYFLYPHKLYFEQKTLNFNSTPLEGDWTLIRNVQKSTPLDVVLSNHAPDNLNIIPINSTYTLGKNGGFTVRYGDGWSGSEGGGRWSTLDAASIIINSRSENMKADLSVKCRPLNNENNLSVYLNGFKITDCDNNNLCAIKEMPLMKGDNVIEFRAKLPAELPGNGDRRKLSYWFELIQFEKIEWTDRDT